MAIKLRGRNRLELLLLFFWSVGWPFILIWAGSQLDYYLSETLITVLIIVFYISAFPIHFFLMDLYFTYKFNKNHNVHCSLKEYRYIKKHLFMIPSDEAMNNYSSDVKKAIYIYMAFQKDIKKKTSINIQNVIKILRENNLM